MLTRLIIICAAIILYPLLLMAWQKRSTIGWYFKNLMPKFNMLSVRKRAKTYLKNKNDVSHFRKLFEKHFNPDIGEFSQEILRNKVYHLCINEVKKGKSYRSLRRNLAGKFFPDKNLNSELMRDERIVLTAYFFENFPEKP